MAVNLHALVARLNPTCKTAMEAAAGLCMARGHYDVEIEHLLLKLLDAEDSDIRRLLHHHGIDQGRLENALNRTLDSFKTGNTRTPALSQQLPELLEAAWLRASLEYGEARLRSGHLLLGLLDSDELWRTTSIWLKALDGLDAQTLSQQFAAVTAQSPEARQAQAFETAPSDSGQPAADGRPSTTPNLDRYCQDLTRQARDGKLDPVLGRDAEIRQMIDILCRRRQNNPILTGDPGVGKTAIVEGLALRIAAGEVPSTLSGVNLLSLDLGLLQAGASVKGEFENRLKGVVDEVKRSPAPIIVFIDEAHTLIGAGGAAGQNDAANLLKPALARGEMRTIAATTWSEYKKYFEKDAAFSRRFQVVKVDEPEEAQAVAMLRSVAQAMARHHGVRVLDEAVREAVRLSSRYIAARQLPDKAVSVLDTACARTAISQHAVPAALEDCRQHLQHLASEQWQLQQEAGSGTNHSARLAEIEAQQAELRAELNGLEQRWQQERKMVAHIGALLDRLEQPRSADTPADPSATAELVQARAELQTLQGDSPMLHALVDAGTVAGVVAAWTGIPLGRMIGDEINAVLELEQRLGERIIGQPHALQAIAQRVRTSRANLEDPNKPKGVFLLVGSSGVGKTETAVALADALYGGERNMITINMSEYQEAHTVSSLKGSPPGYIGYGEGGVLTEAVRRRPHSVVLLDELEKAHPDVLELFFQVFDKGVMEDGEGREIDFRNSLIILTSNAATDLIMQACRQAEQLPTVAELNELIRDELNVTFKPAFLGRCTLIPYYPLADAELRRIVELKLSKIGRRITDNHQASFAWSDALADTITARCQEVDSGARNIDHILTSGLLPTIAEQVLARMGSSARFSHIEADLDQHGQFLVRLS
ncbi:type VI secretion system ATPase TssH [Azotobacter chroococcum]|uniref:type VI secretion system ATPase TssH n=1 Tax=Azotobacter chroococcum TaxID=353 RepID=UPI0010ADDEA6|nr:type VI secretion system ATPase TssH [Azotobacter chroococcum]TKD46935.1 type VI secretion system ATPase TssH [Azotobacter chroococcum]